MISKIRSDLLNCYTSVIHDVLRGMGLRNFTLPPRIRPLDDAKILCGPAFTIEGRLDETASPHETLLAWTDLLSKAKADHIWVSQPHNHTVAQMGELSAETLYRKGVIGSVTDGGLRDTKFIHQLGFPCWGVFNTPRDVVGAWIPTSTETAIHIDDVIINAGDWLHGDRDGMVRIPAAIIRDVTEKSLIAIGTESLVRKAILEGAEPRAYLKYGKF